MKHGRNPSRAEGKVLARHKKDWTEWLFIESRINETDRNLVDMTFAHKVTKEVIVLTTNK